MTRVSPVEGYRLWAPRYDAGPNPVLALEARVLAPLLGPVHSLEVVDVGCGTGRWSERLSRLGARVAGLDICGPMLAQASEKPGVAGRLIQADALALPLRSETADLTICSFVIGYLPDLRGAMAEMARVTKPGGVIAISDFHALAVAAGWTRSFRSGGNVYQVEHVARSGAQLCSEARYAGLKLELQSDQYFGQPERAMFLAAAKNAIFAEIAETPAVWIGIWKKP